MECVFTYGMKRSGDVSDDTHQTWGRHDGQNIEVVVLREYSTTKEKCPKCEGALKAIVGRVDEGEQYFRLECRSCSWASEALSDPKVSY